MMRETFDFISMGLGAILMGLFLMVAYKVMNIWKKSIFKSLYFLCFVVIFAISLWGIFASESNATKLALKDQISTFFAGLHGEVLETETPQEDTGTGYLYESTGALLSGETATGTTLLSGDALLSGTVATGTITSSHITGNTSVQPTTTTASTGTQQST